MSHKVSPKQEAVPTPPTPVKSPALAAVLSWIIPGAGHVYLGQTSRGVAWFLGSIAGYILFVVPGLVVHLMNIADAYTQGQKLQATPVK